MHVQKRQLVWIKWLSVLSLLLCLWGCADSYVASSSEQHYTMEMEQGILTMRDGIELGVTYYKPVPKHKDEVFPVIFEMVPYRKDDFFTLGDYEYGAYFAQRGYVNVRVDVRGTGASSGPIPDREYSEAEIEDAVEIIDQLSRMPWSNGNVGMYGISWSAFNGLMAAHRKPPALKAIIAAHGSTDLFYNDVHYIDGVFHMDMYAQQIDTDNALPRTPDYALDDAYFQDRFDREPWIFNWVRQQQDGDFWRQESLRYKAPLEVPAYLIGGLLDGYRDFVLDVMRNSTAPIIAEIGPWNHAWPEYGVPGPNYEWRHKALRWWDYWLKGIENGILEEPRWMAFMRTGHAPATDLKQVPGYWRCDSSWPVAGNTEQQLFPQFAQHLAHTALHTHQDSLRYRAGVGTAAGNWWGEQTEDMAKDDAYSLVYDSEPLMEAVEIMGRPQVQLQVIADAPLYQWTVRLEDVAPDGTVSLVSGALINPSQRASRLQPQALVPGEPTVLSTAVHFTTWRFRPGHRIRLAVANAQFPMAWPSPFAGTTQLLLGEQTWIKLPVVPSAEQSDAADVCSLPMPDASPKPDFGQYLDQIGPITETHRDDVSGDSIVTTRSDLSWKQYNNHFRSQESYRWYVNDARPAHARYNGERRNTFNIEGSEIDLATQLSIQSDEDHFHLSFTKTLRRDGELVRERTWQDSIPRMYQ